MKKARERIGERIAELRTKRNITIRELAEKSGVNYANIYKIEHGKYNASIDIISKICDALSCKLDILEK